MKYNKFLTLLFYVVFIAKDVLAVEMKLVETNADFTIVKAEISKMDKQNPIMLALIKANTESAQGFLDNNTDTSLTYFTVKYTAPVQLRKETTVKPRLITQYGLYNNLTPELKARLEPAKSTVLNIKIGYDPTEVNFIQFIFDGAAFPTPALVSDTIDTRSLNK